MQIETRYEIEVLPRPGWASHTAQEQARIIVHVKVNGFHNHSFIHTSGPAWAVKDYAEGKISREEYESILFGK